VCWAESIANTNMAHHRVYGETRNTLDWARNWRSAPGPKPSKPSRRSKSNTVRPARTLAHVAACAMTRAPTA
jgi:hypothetical protein